MKSNFIQLQSGIRLHYQEAGQGPLLILLHGFPDFWYGWRHQIAALSAHFRVVAPDMRGYNLSDKPGKVSDYRMEALTADIDQLITALGETETYLVGHDWGGAVAWATTGFYPKKIKKLANQLNSFATLRLFYWTSGLHWLWLGVRRRLKLVLCPSET